MSDQIERLELASEDLVGERVEELLRLFPEAATEGTGRIDFERLRLALGDEVAADDERYAFTWPGKRAAIAQAQAPSYATLRPAPEESVDWDTTQNLYIEGDNLEVLKLLQRSYHGRVKLIYIDPPYNTGHDFVYEDSFGDSIANYKEQAGLAGQANPDTSGRYHSRWCSMMYPRLKLARELLADDGVIFISIDDNESKNLRAICDEVFGEGNFKSDIAWQKRYTRSNNTVDFTTVVEHIFVYAKSDAFEVNLLPRTEEADSRYSNPDDDPRGVWKGKSFLNPATPSQRPNLCYEIVNPNTGIKTLPSDHAWRVSKEEYVRLANENRLYWGSDGRGQVPSIKMFLNEARGLTPINLWSHEYAGNTDRGTAELEELLGANIFDFPKPSLLAKRVLEHASDSNSIVLDFFSGSATTADAVMQLNAEDGGTRKFIMVQLPETCAEGSEAAKAGYATIAEIGKERIRRAGTKIAAEVEEANRQLALGEEPKRVPDVGFRVLKLDESGIARPQGTLQERIVGADRSQLDLVFELMLKWGLDLTLPVERIECAGYPCWSVAADELVCCLDQGLTMEALHAVAALGPRRVLLLDAILTDTLKLNALQIFAHAAERLGHPVDLRTV